MPQRDARCQTRCIVDAIRGMPLPTACAADGMPCRRHAVPTACRADGMPCRRHAAPATACRIAACGAAIRQPDLVFRLADASQVTGVGPITRAPTAAHVAAKLGAADGATKGALVAATKGAPTTAPTRATDARAATATSGSPRMALLRDLVVGAWSGEPSPRDRAPTGAVVAAEPGSTAGWSPCGACDTLGRSCSFRERSTTF